MTRETENRKPDDQSAEDASYQREIEEILRRVDRLPILDTRPDDEILGY
jgi:hypothetical protein